MFNFTNIFKVIRRWPSVYRTGIGGVRVIEHDMGWAYWALNSQRADGSDEDFG